MIARALRSVDDLALSNKRLRHAQDGRPEVLELLRDRHYRRHIADVLATHLRANDVDTYVRWWNRFVADAIVGGWCAIHALGVCPGLAADTSLALLYCLTFEFCADFFDVPREAVKNSFFGLLQLLKDSTHHDQGEVTSPRSCDAAIATLARAAAMLNDQDMKVANAAVDDAKQLLARPDVHVVLVGLRAMVFGCRTCFHRPPRPLKNGASEAVR